MKKWTTKSGTEIFLVSSGRSNAYLVSGRGVNVLVDTGKASAYDRLRKNIESLNLAQKNIDSLILTHTHYDHCQNALSLKTQDNCWILMSAKEAEYVGKGYTPLPKGTFALTRLISGLGNSLGNRGFAYKPFTPDFLIDEEFDFAQNGFLLKVTSTPGHSEGSVSVIVDDEVAIVGDAMLGTLKNSIFPPFADDITRMINSWEKLLRTGCEIFLPGHGRAVNRALLQREYASYARKFNITQIP